MPNEIAITTLTELPPQKDIQRLIEGSFAFYLNKKGLSEKLVYDTFPGFYELYQQNLVAKTAEAEELYLKELLTVTPAVEEFNKFRAHIAPPQGAYIMDVIKEACDGLRQFRFSDEEIFSHLTSTVIGLDGKDATYAHYSYIKENWDGTKLFIKLVSERMRDGVGLEEAIGAEMLNPKRDPYSKTTALHFFLTREIKIELYEHARAKQIIFHHFYNPKSAEQSILREIATFHVDHEFKFQKNLFFKTDCAMRDIGLSPAQCLELLKTQASKASVLKLKQKVELMPSLVKQMKGLMTGTNVTQGLTFEAAVNQTFTAAVLTVLSLIDFRQLLSLDNQAQLGLYTPPPVAKLPPAPTSRPAPVNPTAATAAKLNLFSSTAQFNATLPTPPRLPLVRPLPVHNGVHVMSTSQFRIHEALGFGVGLLALGLFIYAVRPGVITVPLEAGRRLLVNSAQLTMNLASTLFGKGKAKTEEETPLFTATDLSQEDEENFANESDTPRL